MSGFSSVKSTIEEMLGGITELDPAYPFRVRVGCVKMSAPRHERFFGLLDMGIGTVQRIFDGSDFSGSTLTLVFPERYMSVHEQHGMMTALLNHPDVDRIKEVDIITSCPLLVGNFHREQILILTWPDDYLHDGRIHSE